MLDELPAAPPNSPPRLLDEALRAVTVLIEAMSRQLRVARRRLQEYQNRRRERRYALIEEDRARRAADRIRRRQQRADNQLVLDPDSSTSPSDYEDESD